jgi:murein L,D-transpeptidase YcbB/YkuD
MPRSATSIGECGLLEPPVAVPAARKIAPPAPIRLEAGTVDSLSLRLNIPAYRLEVVEGERIVREIQVAVGTPDHPTPIGDFRVTSLVWNPWWIPPPFDWAKDEKATPPGPNNPTGRVKLFFGYYLFLHGTPDEASLGQAASHGCVRMRNADAIALARTVHAHASPNLPAAVLDTLEANTRRTRSIGLEVPVPLSIRYDLVEVRGGRIEVHVDIYGSGAAGADEVVAVLGRAGVDPGDVDPDELRAALRAPPPLEIPLSRILRRDPQPR